MCGSCDGDPLFLAALPLDPDLRLLQETQDVEVEVAPRFVQALQCRDELE